MRLKSKLLGCAVLAAVTASSALADSYTLIMSGSQTGSYWATPEGQLTDVLANYAAPYRTDISYLSMCVEKDEYFWSGKRYNGSITGTTADGGGADNTGIDPISVGTAYLYKQLVTGTLSGLLNNLSDLSARVQNTIWFLEGEQGAGDATLLAHLGSVFGQGGYLGNYAGDEVKVINLTKFDGGGGDGQANWSRQDQLVLHSVPDGGATVAMLAASLCALVVARRRRA